MDNLNLISNFAEFKELKNIDKSTMIGVLEDVFRHALQKQYETDENFDVIINPEKGDLEIWRNRTVVEDDAVEDPNAQISVSEVKAIDPTYEIGDEYADEIKLASFGRRAVLSLRQNLASRILDTRPDARHLDALDITVRRNAFGRQTDSFEADLEFTGITDLPEAAPLRGVFIRAPWVEEVGPEVSVLARVPEGATPDGRADGRIVAVAQGSVLATSFHPEVTGDLRVHQFFVDRVRH